MQPYVEARLSEQAARAIWQGLFEDLRRERLIRPATLRVALRLLVLSGLLGIGLWFAWFATSRVALAAAWVALALLLAQFAFIGHDAGHRAISGTPWADRIIGQVSMTLITGLGFDEWIARHLAHHRHCQDETRDPDMAVAVMV